MEGLVVIVSVFFLILSIIILVRFFGLCSDVKRIADKINPKVDKIDPDKISEEEAERIFREDHQRLLRFRHLGEL